MHFLGENFRRTKKLLCGKAAEKVLSEYKEIIAVIIPEIRPCFGFAQNNPHHCYDIWEHIIKSVSFVRPEPVIRTAMLLHDIGKPSMATKDENGVSHFKSINLSVQKMADEILKRLRFDSRSISYIHDLIWEHDNRIPADMHSVKRFISKYDFQFMLDYLEVRRGDTYAQSDYRRAEKLAELDEIARLTIELADQDTCLKISDLAVNGNDLIALGLDGRNIGIWLEKLLELVIEDKIKNDKTALLEYIKDNIK